MNAAIVNAIQVYAIVVYGCEIFGTFKSIGNDEGMRGNDDADAVE